MKEISDQDAAYLAGLIDGEGCISVSRTRTNQSAKQNKRGFAYRSSLEIRMTCIATIQWIRKTTGVGRIRQVKVTGNRKPAWNWITWSKEAAELLKVIKPYMITKAINADNLIRFQAGMRQPGRLGLSDNEWHNRETYYNLSKKLNARGANAYQQP